MILAGLMLATALTMTSALVLRARAPKVPVLGSVPEFALVDHQKRPIGLSELRGRVWVADFIFTSCGSICPVMTAHMGRLRPRLPEGTRLVSFTVDPEHDTPEVLAAYGERHGAGPEWSFVTGSQKALYELAGAGFKLPVEISPEGDPRFDGPFVHSQRFVLVDAEGRIRGYYDSNDPQDLERLVAEAHRVAG